MLKPLSLRYWMLSFSDRTHTADITPLLQKGKKIAKIQPKTFISDGAGNFHDAYMKDFHTLRNPKTRHIKHIRLQGDYNNNKMERMNGEVRDREKTMRGLKKMGTPILKGYQL
jgi:transposase-like protein